MPRARFWDDDEIKSLIILKALADKETRAWN